MPIERQCPACGNAQERDLRLAIVPGLKGILVDQTCESCRHAWNSKLRILFITDAVSTVRLATPK